MILLASLVDGKVSLSEVFLVLIPLILNLLGELATKMLNVGKLFAAIFEPRLQVSDLCFGGCQPVFSDLPCCRKLRLNFVCLGKRLEC